MSEPLCFCTSHPRKVSLALVQLVLFPPPTLFGACYLLLWVNPLLSFLLALICSFLPLQMGRASRIFFSGKHDPHLLLQHCHQDRKRSEGRGQVKSSFSLSFLICPSTHTLDFLHRTWKGSSQILTLICYMVGFLFRFRTKKPGDDAASRQQGRALSCALCFPTASHGLHLQSDWHTTEQDSVVVPSYSLPKPYPNIIA